MVVVEESVEAIILMDLRQVGEYRKFLGGIGWITHYDKASKATIFIRRVPLTIFGVLKIQRPDKLPSDTVLKKLIKEHRIVQTNIEPLNDVDVPRLARLGYRRNLIPFLPSNTILVDLTMSEAHLMKLMKPKTRYNLKMAEKRGVRLQIYDGTQLLSDMYLFESLFEMQRANAKRLGIFVLPRRWFLAQVKSFGTACFAAMAYYEDRLMAATFYMTSDTTVYYSHNGSVSEGRKLCAPTLCVWAGIQEGKRRKKKWLDFEGIYDPRSHVVRWKGFTRFKGGFGGREYMLPGLYSRWHWPF